VALWSEILRALPEARMLLKSASLDDRGVQDDYARLFALHGVARERVCFVGRSTYPEHLEMHRDIDIALDPYPYNGGATTLDALWMGIPVVTLRGERFVSRFGVSILSNIGLPHLIAESPQEYAAKAIALAGDVEHLTQLRGSLRERLSRSPLCDGAGFARDLEALYRRMWKAWCQSQSVA
jgi:predicted O-linked N-acetylglucosamine transferase (SPINDLY family)